MVPSMARLAHARLAPSHSCAFHLPSSVGGGWSDESGDDDDYSSSSSSSSGVNVGAALALASLDLVEMPIGATIMPGWYDGSLASMVAINNEECSICLEPLITGHPVAQEPVGVGPNAWVVACMNRHAFHRRCITTASTHSKACPMCRAPLLLGDAAPAQPPQPPLNETLAAIQLAKDAAAAIQLAKDAQAAAIQLAKDAQAAAIQLAKDAPTPAEARAADQKAQEPLEEERAVRKASTRAKREARRKTRPSRPELARRAARAKKQREEEEELEETLLWDVWHARRMIACEGG